MNESDTGDQSRRAQQKVSAMAPKKVDPSGGGDITWDCVGRICLLLHSLDVSTGKEKYSGVQNCPDVFDFGIFCTLEQVLR